MSDIPAKYIREPLPRDFAIADKYQHLSNAVGFADDLARHMPARSIFIREVNGRYCVCTTEVKPVNEIPENLRQGDFKGEYSVIDSFHQIEGAITCAGAYKKYGWSEIKIFIMKKAGKYYVCCESKARPVLKPLDDGHYVFKAKELELLERLFADYYQSARPAGEANKYAAQIAAFKELMFVENEV